VVTARALKYNGGVAKADLSAPNIDALKRGIVNLKTHIKNIKKFGVPVVVAINRFASDRVEELEYIRDYCAEMCVKAAFSDVFAKGGEGGIELAEAVCEVIENEEARFKPLYDLNMHVKEKLGVIAKEIYRADGVNYTLVAEKEIAEIEAAGFANLPVCVAKTQYSLSDDPLKLGAPRDFTILVRDVRLSAGAGFIVALTGEIMTMPGLPKIPSASNIDISADGAISGLF
jgi:formate--tetrahydrofolate ligase